MLRPIGMAMMASLLLLLSGSPGVARSPADLVAEFSARDNAAAWMPGRPYMRRLEDETWKGRIGTLQRLVAAGDQSIPPLLTALRGDDEPTRILAAQALGYLGPDVPRAPLLEAAGSDPNPAVRLYAVDALGMQGGRDPAEELAPLLKREKNGDVRKHIGYALERKEASIEPAIVERLARWDPKQAGTAQVGQPAPDFTLSTVSGRPIRLSDNRGKQAVVLVFIYGDT